jgi:2-polyprenyl-3-methyl-5-hydroxy-6-metoxy-1,4-benzoquinol methylase
MDPLPSSEQISSYYDSAYFRGQKDFFAGSDYCETRDAGIVHKTVTGYEEVVSSFDIGGKSILDIGCASGALLKLLSSHNPAKLTGIDIAEYPILYGKDRYGLDLRCTSLEAAAFLTGSFDLILMIDIIEHIEALPSFLQEVKRVLRPSGSVFLITPNYHAFMWARSR